MFVGVESRQLLWKLEAAAKAGVWFGGADGDEGQKRPES